jgi:hypothetical protein
MDGTVQICRGFTVAQRLSQLVIARGLAVRILGWHSTKRLGPPSYGAKSRYENSAAQTSKRGELSGETKKLSLPWNLNAPAESWRNGLSNQSPVVASLKIHGAWRPRAVMAASRK